MSDVLRVDMVGVDNRWVKLLLTLCNSTKTVFICSFENQAESNRARSNFNSAIRHYPSWFNVLIAQRGCDVYVIKLQDQQKVVIRDG